MIDYQDICQATAKQDKFSISQDRIPLEKDANILI